MNTCGWGDGTSDCRQACYLLADDSARDLWMDDFVCMLNEGCADPPAEASAGYASAQDTVERWKNRNSCMGDPAMDAPLDLVSSRSGVDTSVTRWSDCARGTDVRLWRINRAGHVPAFRRTYGAGVVEWMLSTRRSAAE